MKNETDSALHSQFSALNSTLIRPGYKQSEVGVIPEEWQVRTIGQIAPLQRGFDLPTSQIKDGPYPVVYSNGVANYHVQAMARGPGVVTGRSGTLGKVHYVATDFWPHNTSLWVTRFNGNDERFVYYLYSAIGFERFASGSGVPTLNRNDAHAFHTAIPPTVAEQQAIAEALSDADALIESLEKLIAKKRQIKQGAMQELLTGKTRLPGFSGEWETLSFDRALARLNVKIHQIKTAEYEKSGEFAVIDQGKEPIVGFSDLRARRFRCPNGGVIVFGDHTCIVKFVDFDFLVGADGTQVLQAKTGQCTRFYAYQLQHRGVEPTGYNRHFKFLREREYLAPPMQEQVAVASVLSDMDAEIAALETKLAKARQIKQGMMQELLTGRIRLISGELRMENGE